MSVHAYCNVVLGKHCSISRAQADEIDAEFEVRPVTRGIRKGQAKKLKVDPESKTLSMQGPPDKMSAAYNRLMELMRENGESGVAKDWHEQEALRQKMRQEASKTKKKKAAELEERRKAFRKKLEAKKPQQPLKPQKPKCPPPSYLLANRSGQQQSRSDNKPSGNEKKLNEFQMECLERVRNLQDKMGKLVSL